MHEFDIIQHFFVTQTKKRNDVSIGIGDDAAIVRVPAGFDCVIAMDTLNQDVHFFADCPPADIGYKALAVNLSDLAAMGAKPAWMTLSLAMPQVDNTWLASFCGGLFECANQFDVQLIGGDLTQGPLSVCITVQGLIESGQALQRNAAKVGDLIYVTGRLGDAAFAVECLRANQPCDANSISALHRPIPKVDIGRAILNKAHAAIDISDGLLQDLQHLLTASQLGAEIDIDLLPCDNDKIIHALKGGDDFELCFTIAKEFEPQLAAIQSCALTKIGEITQGDKLIVTQNGRAIDIENGGYQHF